MSEQKSVDLPFTPDQVARGEPRLRKTIEAAINANSAENGSNTPDFILAEYLTDCLAAFDKAVVRRGDWYGRHDRIGGPIVVPR
ncbi:MAG: hypothetical protein Q8K32_09225 [Archangium sp.]|nr:hypothetical protein [Archangium sp.]